LNSNFFISKAKPEDTLDLSRFLNDDLAKTVSKNPKRFVGLGTLPMQAPELGICFNLNIKL
jgi:aminocarboxymuconate-semialdehyde decarboxylase